MLSAIRKNQHSLTLLVVILTIISFIWLYNRTNLSQVGSNDIVSVYGHVIQQAQIERLAREYQLAMALGLTDIVRDLGGFSDNEEMALTSYILNSLVLEHQSKVLNVTPTDESITTAIQSLPVFQVNGAFSAAKYASFLQEQLIPRGFTERHLEEVIANSLRFKKLHEIILSPIAVSEAQVREIAAIYQPVTAQVVYFNRSAYLKDPKNLKAITITQEEEKAFYEKNKPAFVSDEMRSINYVVVELPASQQQLKGKERVHAMQQLSDNLSSLKQKTEDAIKQGKTFKSVAADNGFKVVSTADFNQRGEKSGDSSVAKNSPKKATPSEHNKEQLPPKEVASMAFKLDKVSDVTDVAQIGPAFYIASLERITPSHPLTFNEVQSKIEQVLREQKANQLMSEAAKKTLQSIRQSMATGKSFSDALKAANKTAETLNGLVPATMAKNKVPLNQQEVISATLLLKEGELSDIKHTSQGDFLVYLQHRAPLSPTDWNAHHSEIEERFLQQQQNLFFAEWLRQSRADANITMLDKRHRGRRG